MRKHRGILGPLQIGTTLAILERAAQHEERIYYEIAATEGFRTNSNFLLQGPSFPTVGKKPIFRWASAGMNLTASG